MLIGEKYEAVIGFEFHAQFASQSKFFQLLFDDKVQSSLAF
jgi:hypothetical protein